MVIEAEKPSSLTDCFVGTACTDFTVTEIYAPEDTDNDGEIEP